VEIGLPIIALVLALLLAFLGQQLFSDRAYFNQALWLYGVAVLAMWVYAWEERRRPVIPRPRSLWRVGSAAGSFLALVLCLLLQVKGVAYIGQAFAWLTSLVLLAITFVPSRHDWRGLFTRWWARKSEIALIIVITVLGLVLRAYNLEYIPGGFHGDEGEFGTYALSILEGNMLPPFYTGWFTHANLFFELQALSMAIFGVSVAGIRMLSAISGALTLPPLYLLMRRMFGPWAAAIATFFFAVSPWHIHFSRIAWNEIQVPLFCAFGLYFLYRGIESGRAFDYCLSGLNIGLCVVLGSKSGLYFPLITGLLLLYMIITRRGFLRQQYQNLFVLGVAALFAFAPLGLHYIQHNWRVLLLDPVRNKSILQNMDRVYAVYGTRDIGKILLRQAEKAVLVFNCYVDSGFYSFAQEPVLGRLTAPLYVLGLAYSLYHWKEAKYALLFFWYAVPVMGNVTSIDIPQSHRLVAMTPVPFMLASLPLEKLRQETDALLPSLKSRWRMFSYAVPLVIFLGLVGYKDYETYFIRYTTRWPWTDVADVARQIRKLGNDYQIYLISDLPVGHGTIRFIAHKVKVTEARHIAYFLPIREEVNKDVAFIVTPSHYQMLPFIRKYYPDGVLTRHSQFICYIVEKDEIHRRLQAIGMETGGLLGKYYLNLTWVGEPALQRLDPLIALRDFYLLTSGPFSVQWDGRIHASQPGRYTFQAFANGEVWLSIDGRLVLRNEQLIGERWQPGEIELAAGLHEISIYYRSLRVPGLMELYWTPPGGAMELVPTDVLGR